MKRIWRNQCSSECNNRHEWQREWVMGEKKRKRMKVKKRKKNPEQITVEFSLLRLDFCVSLHWNVIIYDFMTSVTMYEGYGSAFKSHCAIVSNGERANHWRRRLTQSNMFFGFSSERRCAASTNVQIPDCIRSCFFFALLKIACSSNRRYVAVSILCNNFYAIWNNFWWRIFENISSRSVWAKKREQKNGKNVNMNMIFSSYSVTQFDAHSPKAKNVFNCVALSHAQCTHRMRLNTIAHFMNMPRVPAATANTLVRSFVCMILYGFSARSVYLYAQFCFYGFALNKIWLL